jgi:hypothetical protein
MRLVTAFLILVLASGIQFWLSGGGIFLNLIFAALIVFAFFFDFWEMALFVLLGVLVINWQPAPSTEIFLFAFIPLIVFALRGVVRSERWVTVPIAIVCGLLVFYAIADPHFLLSNPVAFLEDLFGSLIAGELVFWAMGRITKR